MELFRIGRKESEVGINLCTIILLIQKIKVTLKMFKSNME